MERCRCENRNKNWEKDTNGSGTRLSNIICLAYWGLNEIADILQTPFLSEIFKESIWISIHISLKFVPKGPIARKSKFAGNKSLTKMFTQVYYAMWCH